MRPGQPTAPGPVLTRHPGSGRSGDTTTTGTGATAGAWALAAAVAAAVLLAPDPARTVLVLVLAAAQAALALVAHRAAGPSAWRRVAVLWSLQAGLTWAVAGEPTTASALVYLTVGIVFALAAEGVLRLAGRFAEPPVPDDGPPPTDTAPLPVVGDTDGEGSR